MALVSPGVEVTVIDESQYVSSAINSVPYILIATAENKINAAGTAVAPGTVPSDTNDIYLITSQRELVNTFGNPFFYKTSGGSSINGYELNEYGLHAAYSVLGTTNRAYVQRVDVDLAELSASLVRPRGNPNNGDYWLDLTESEFGIFVWNSATNAFDNIEPIIITDTDDLLAGVPLDTIGNIGAYAVVATNANNPVYFKNSNNEWVLIGSDDWKASLPIVIGTEVNPTITAGTEIDINGTVVTASGTTLASIVTDINNAGITGVTVAEVDNRIEFYVESGAGSDSSSVDVTLTLANSGYSGDLVGDLGLTEGTYAGLLVAHEPHTNIPRWRTTDITPRPSGSIWVKTTAVNEGISLAVKRYDSVTDTFIVQPCPAYANDETANSEIDPGAGGENIAAGATYCQFDVLDNDTGTLKVFSRTPGETIVTGTVQNPTFVAGDKFEVSVSLPNDANLTSPVEITLTGTDAAGFVADWIAAGIPYTSIEVTTNGRIQITHDAGGVILLDETYVGAGSAINAAGFDASTELVRENNIGQLILSNWEVLEYFASEDEPGQDPLDGTRWFYSAIDEADIMIQDDGAWKGYRNVSNDVRGHDLTITNATGPQFSAVAPEFQSDSTALEYGDLWIDTSDLENYPMINRWENVDGVDQWVRIANEDQTTINGVVFADARWANNETTDPVGDDLPLITDLLGSDYVDIDAPNPALYPPGTLLFNMRRSGYNVKEFRNNYFNAQDFSSSILPTEKNAWVTVSGLRNDGSPNMGRFAQRALVVAAMKAAIDTSEDAREEQRTFNLLAAPGYPELIPNMVALNNERNNTGFIIGDSPMRLPNSGEELVDWATNRNGIGLPEGDGLAANDEYLGVFYPSGQTTDLTGAPIVVPPSHMMLRTIIHSDEQSYPWFAPAGVRRGQVDNVSAIGYIDGQSGEFRQLNVRQGVRDVLYTNNVNPITFQVGAGIVNYGNKTTQPSSALDRINVARLVAYLRFQLDVAAKPFIFEPNDEITRNEIKNVIEGLMNDLVAKRALYDYAVVCDRSNNTPQRIDSNELWVDIAIEPVKAVEFIYIPVRIKNTGEIGNNPNG